MGRCFTNAIACAAPSEPSIPTTTRYWTVVISILPRTRSEGRHGDDARGHLDRACHERCLRDEHCARRVTQHVVGDARAQESGPHRLPLRPEDDEIRVPGERASKDV